MISQQYHAKYFVFGFNTSLNAQSNENRGFPVLIIETFKIVSSFQIT